MTAMTRAPQRRRPEGISGSAPADLEQALTDLGIEVLKADDDEVVARCPLHAYYTGKEDGSPSWSVNRQTGHHNCFSCQFGGSWIALVCELLEIGPFEAARWTKGYGLNLERAESIPEWDERADTPKAKRSKIVAESDLAQFSTPPPEALDCRSITLESARHFGVLWEPSTTRWVFPIRLADGTLIGWQWKGEHRLRGGERTVKNWPFKVQKSLTLFGADVFPTGAPAVVVEGPFEPVRLHSAGMEGGLSTWGDKFSDEQMRVLRDLTDEVIWASDNDEAGRAMARVFRDGDVKTKRPAYARRFVSRFLNYDMLPGEPKDFGEPGIDNIHILRAVRGARHVLLADLGESSGIQRQAKAVSSTRVPNNGRARPGTSGVRAGDRKDTANYRRNRKAGRGVR